MDFMYTIWNSKYK